MELSLIPTLAILGGALALFAFARRRARLPADPFRIRMIDYTFVQYGAAIVALLMIVHLVGLWSGRPLPGRFGFG